MDHSEDSLMIIPDDVSEFLDRDNNALSSFTTQPSLSQSADALLHQIDPISSTDYSNDFLMECESFENDLACPNENYDNIDAANFNFNTVDMKSKSGIDPVNTDPYSCKKDGDNYDLVDKNHCQEKLTIDASCSDSFRVEYKKVEEADGQLRKGNTTKVHLISDQSNFSFDCHTNSTNQNDKDNLAMNDSTDVPKRPKLLAKFKYISDLKKVEYSIFYKEGSENANNNSAETSLPHKNIAQKITETPNEPSIPKKCEIVLKPKINLATLMNSLVRITGHSSRKLNKKNYLSIRPMPSVWPRGRMMAKCLWKIESMIEDIVSEDAALEWLIQHRFIKRPVCDGCSETFEYSVQTDDETGSDCQQNTWICRCGNSIPILLPPSISKLNSMQKLIFKIYCWATRDANIESLLNIMDKEFISETYALYTSLQSLCTRILARDCTKLGSFFDSPIYLATVQIGTVYILAAMEGKSKAMRMTALDQEAIKDAAMKGINLFNEKVKEWVALPSTLRVCERKFSSLVNLGYQIIFFSKSEFSENENRFREDNIGGYLVNHLQKMLKYIDINSLNCSSLNLLLGELEWREKYGYEPCVAFRNILTHIATDPLCTTTAVDRSFATMHQLNAVKNSDDWICKNWKSCIQEKDLDETVKLFMGPDENKQTKVHSQSSNTVKVDEYYVEEFFYGHWKSTADDDIDYDDDDGDDDDDPECAEKKPCLDVICHLCHMHFNRSNIVKHIIEHLDTIKPIENQARDDLRVRCNHCLKIFGPKALHLHKELFAGQIQRFACRICCLAFASRSKFLNHMIHSHWPKEAPYRCEICEYRSSFQKDLLHHFDKNHLDEVIAVCTICLTPIQCSSVHKLSSTVFDHVERHFDVLTKHSCLNCSLSFTSAIELEYHFSTCHSDPSSNAAEFQPYEVQNRDETFSTIATRDELERSKLTKTAVNFFSSFKFVDNKTERLRNLNLNALKEKLAEGQVLKCVECGSRIISESHFFQSEIKCNFCVFRTHCSTSAKNHQNKHRTNIRVIPPAAIVHYRCRCGFAPINNDDLVEHMVTVNHYTCRRRYNPVRR